MEHMVYEGVFAWIIQMEMKNQMGRPYSKITVEGYADCSLRVARSVSIRTDERVYAIAAKSCSHTVHHICSEFLQHNLCEAPF